MSIQNLRNKYSDHPFFIPLINYCEENNISFEIMKESRINEGYKLKKIYYMKIKDVLISSYLENNSFSSLSFMLAKAYSYIGLEIPDGLNNLIKYLEDKNNV